MTKAEAKAIAPILRAVAEVDLSGLGAMAQALLDRLRPANSGRKKASRKQREAKTDTRREEVFAIRTAVLKRAGSRCELCGWEGVLHLHHVVSGSGLRRAQEGVATCIALCLSCHRCVHVNDPGTLEGLEAWAHRHGNATALLAVQKRIARARSFHPEST